MDAALGGGITKFVMSLLYRGHPHFVVFGQDKRLPYSLLLQKAEPIYYFDDYVRLRVSDF